MIQRLCEASLGSCTRRLLPLSILLALIFTSLPARAAYADGPSPIEDQSYTAPGIAAVAFSGPAQYIAQTFTAGLTGALTGVSVDIASGDTGEMYVRIVGVTDGLPNGTVLGEHFLSGVTTAPLSYVVSFDPIYVTAGTQYAIVVNYTGNWTHGTWVGGEGDPYPRGKVLIGEEYTLTQWTATQAGLDLHFRTFVVPNVRISDLQIERISGPTKARACATFTETYRVTNLGPDPAPKVRVMSGATDQFDVLSTDGAPQRESDVFPLDVGQSRLLAVEYKVTGFVPGESRSGGVYINVSLAAWPDLAFDLHPENDDNHLQFRLIGKPAASCL